ncbi:hypothetical protein L596_020497 [Steinernema carpocapsae]|uniref:beta-N-acetylhexosaminidase n=1 Tax=Steinernema carpocapsae TaxID=34508 RepID=A0A4V6A0Y0_STECR|nr:hypothetical protein L596_020497 [Steinernema carpocapsae]
MRAAAILTLLLHLVLVQAWYYGRPDPGLMTKGGIWPLPWKVVYQNATHILDPTRFEFITDGESCDILDAAYKRYKKLIFNGPITEQIPTLDGIQVSIRDGCGSKAFPKMGMDESYKLTVPADGSIANLEANEIWGILRGLETFSQLVYRDGYSLYFVAAATIEDHPRFPHRAVLIDSVRHFLPVQVILRNIDLMAQNKYNVLHWHLTDSEAFPYESKKFPKLAKLGAYTRSHIHSRKDVARVIEFARLRGIRVIPEFDTPGHMGAWGKGQPGLLSKCYSTNPKRPMLENIIDPSKKENFQFLKEFFEEALETFPDNNIHLGGDEVGGLMHDCWLRNPRVHQWMQDNGYGDNVSSVLKMYISQLVDIIQTSRNGTNMIFWQEVLDMNVAPKNTIAHVWKGTR